MKGCVLCGGSGWFPTHRSGRGAFKEMTYETVIRCLCVKFGAPQVLDDSCSRCYGHGIYGGHIGTKFDGPWKWCDCPAGVERQQRQPALIAESNTCREKCIRLEGRRNGKGLQPVGALFEPYHGAF